MCSWMEGAKVITLIKIRDPNAVMSTTCPCLLLNTVANKYIKSTDAT